MNRKNGVAVLDPAHGGGILGELARQGPLTLPEIPHRWPLVRPILERQVRRLVAEGLVERVPSRRVPGKTAYSLTRQGRATLASGSG
jgi:DNA-binding HxlR family transcriptional regulator